jgi:hypothetical protein
LFVVINNYELWNSWSCLRWIKSSWRIQLNLGHFVMCDPHSLLRNWQPGHCIN